MDEALPEAWQPIVGDELTKPYYHKLQDFLAAEHQAHTVYPPEPDVFNALRFTPYADVRVLILGQDPYHDEGQAHGLAFSVRPADSESLADSYWRGRYHGRGFVTDAR